MPIGKTYPEYKDSGVDWFGMIPKKWNVIPLKYLTLSKVSDGPHETPLFIDEGIPFLSVDGIQNNELVFEGCRFISEIDHERYSLKCKPVQGDVLLGKAASVGKVAYVRTKIEFNVWSPLAVISAHNRKLGKFIYYSLQSEILQYQCEVYSNSNTQKNLGMATIDNLLFSAPIDNKEIEYIIDFLDHETAKIDTMIEKQKTLIELLKEKRQAVISHAVTKGLDDSVPMKDSGVEWLDSYPEHWLFAGFKKYLDSVVDYRGRTPTKIDFGRFLITARNIKRGYIDYLISQEYISESEYHEVMQRGQIHIGDVLFTTEAPLGEVAQIDRDDIALAQRIMKFSGNPKRLTNNYLRFYIMSDPFQQGLLNSASGSTALGIRSDRLGMLKTLIPPIKEQKNIVNHINIEIINYDLLSEKANDQIVLLQERRTALISAAVTGKIDLRDWSIDT